MDVERVLTGGLKDRDAYVRPGSVTLPYFPKQLRDAGIKGSVVVEVEVDSNNAVGSPRVIKSDHPELDMLAIETVLNWKYVTGGGQWTQCPLPFAGYRNLRSYRLSRR